MTKEDRPRPRRVVKKKKDATEYWGVVSEQKTAFPHLSGPSARKNTRLIFSGSSHVGSRTSENSYFFGNEAVWKASRTLSKTC